MVQREVEVKVLDIDRHAIEKKLLGLGAKKIFDEDMEVFSFVPTNGVDVLRVRTEGPDTFLIIKKTVSGSLFAKSSDEYSVKIGDASTMTHILSMLGFKEKKPPFKKHRISYRFEDARFEFDKFLGEFDFVPEFMEIEADSESRLQELLALLNIPHTLALPWTGGDVIRHYQK